MADTQQQLEWERNNRGWAITAATAGALLTLVAFIIAPLLLNVEVTPNNSPSQVIFIDAHATELLLLAALKALGVLATGAALYYLYRAVIARGTLALGSRQATDRGNEGRGTPGGVARFCIVFGAIALAVASPAVQIVYTIDASSFLDTAKTYEQARAVLLSPAAQAFSYIQLAGSLAFGFAFIVIALNAMRVGLLTRFLGTLGIISGVLYVIPLLPIVVSFWLAAFAMMLSGRIPDRTPPAWRSGKAEPWPSPQAMRELQQQKSES